MGEAKLVHAHVYDPTVPNIFIKAKKSDPAEYHTVTCTMSDKCSLFAKRQCAARVLMGGGCVYGSVSRERGPIQRAKNFYDWIKARKESATKIGQLSAPPNKVALIGDMVWLPYAHMNIVLGCGANMSQFTRAQFVPVAEFNADMVSRLCYGRPTGWSGDEITSYQKETIPLFISHLAEEFPELLAEASLISPKIGSVLASLTKVGRKAKLSTVKPDVGEFEGYTWDGVYMTCCDRKKTSAFTKFEAKEMRLLPGDNAVVVITDDAQVTPATVFID